MIAGCSTRVEVEACVSLRGRDDRKFIESVVRLELRYPHQGANDQRKAWHIVVLAGGYDIPFLIRARSVAGYKLDGGQVRSEIS